MLEHFYLLSTEEKRMRLCFSLVFVALFLSSCAPANNGSSVYFPILLDNEGQVASVVAGKRSYVAVRYGAAVFGFSKSDFDKEFDLNFRSPQDGEHEVFWLRYKSNDAPEDWRLNLHSVHAVRTIDRRDNDGQYITVYYYNRISLIYAVDVPADAAPGRHDFKVRIKDNVNPAPAREFDARLQLNVVAANPGN
jgi:hypothetical protein